MTTLHELRLAIALCLLGSVLSLVAVRRVWVDGTGFSLGVPAVDLTGSDVVPSVAALSWLALAAALALIATRSWARMFVGATMCAAGLGSAVVAVAWAATGSNELLVDGVRVGSGDRVLWWAAVSALGGLCVAAAGLLVVVRGRGWAGLSSSYEAPGAARPEPVTDKGVWDALDRGDDPTS